MVPPTGTFDRDPVHTFAGFSAQHLVVGRVRPFPRRCEAWSPVAEERTASTVEVSIDTASVNTSNSPRNDDLRSEHYLDVVDTQR